MVRFFAHSHSIPLSFCSVSIPSHFSPIPSYPIASCIHPQLLLSFSCRMVRFFAHSHSILFHPISILFHFYSISFLSHHLLYTPSIVALILLSDGPLFCPFSFHPISILFWFYSISSHFIPIPSYPITSCILPQLLLSFSCQMVRFFAQSHSISFLSHHLLYTPSLVAPILMLDGPLFWSLWYVPMPFPSHLILFHSHSWKSPAGPAASTHCPGI